MANVVRDLFIKFLFLLLFGLVAACGGGDNTDTSGNDPQNPDPAPAPNTPANLSISVKDTLTSDTPVEGVIVVLHNADKRTIAQTITTDATGVADFGEQTGPLTVTVAYNGTQIKTIMDIQPRAYTLYTNPTDACIPRTAYTVTVNNVSDSTQINLKAQDHNLSNHIGYTAADTPADMSAATYHCSSDDGKNLVLTAINNFYYGRSFPNYAGNVVKYLPVNNISLIDGGITLDYSSLLAGDSFSWTSNVLSHVYTYAKNGNKIYRTGFRKAGTVNGSLSTGETTTVAGQVPTTRFIASAENETQLSAVDVFDQNDEFILWSEFGYRSRKVNRGFDTFTNNTTFTYANTEVSNFNYNQTSRVASFTVSGTNAIDYTHFYVQSGGIRWDIIANPETRNIALPDLPPELTSWLDMNDFANLPQPNQRFHLGVYMVNLETTVPYSEMIQNVFVSDMPIDFSPTEQRSGYFVIYDIGV